MENKILKKTQRISLNNSCLLWIYIRTAKAISLVIEVQVAIW